MGRLRSRHRVAEEISRIGFRYKGLNAGGAEGTGACSRDEPQTEMYDRHHNAVLGSHRARRK